MRGAYYEDTLIEFDKFSFNLMYAQTFGKRFLYVVQMDDMGYVFDISALYNEGYDFGWESRELPKQTEFAEKRANNKGCRVYKHRKHHICLQNMVII